MKAVPVLIAVALGLGEAGARAEPPLFVGVIEDVEAVNLSPAMSSIHVGERHGSFAGAAPLPF